MSFCSPPSPDITQVHNSTQGRARPDQHPRPQQLRSTPRAAIHIHQSFHLPPLRSPIRLPPPLQQSHHHHHRPHLSHLHSNPPETLPNRWASALADLFSSLTSRPRFHQRSRFQTQQITKKGNHEHVGTRTARSRNSILWCSYATRAGSHRARVLKDIIPPLWKRRRASECGIQQESVGRGRIRVDDIGLYDP